MFFLVFVLFGFAELKVLDCFSNKHLSAQTSQNGTSELQQRSTFA